MNLQTIIYTCFFLNTWKCKSFSYVFLQGGGPVGNRDYRYIVASIRENVGWIRLNRPEVLNALNLQLVSELVTALTEMDRDDHVRCMVITGNEKAFAAGADIPEMAEASSVEMLLQDQIAEWDRIRKLAKPLIAAVNGYALGGGCELAMACDLIVASETAVFGQPEILLGIMPGAGGTQRLTRAIGKVRAMEMVLTGRSMTAREALQAGLINRVVPPELVEAEAMNLAKKIAQQPPVAVRLAKQAVLKAMDTTLETGLDYEQKLFYFLFSTEDQKEGMRAFVEKRKPRFQGK
ncbi:enoyl-CoA hydratase/isomerase family protein [Polycladomyces sp. WAk]|uniref:Enoyl-CoA hydratase/isomerase family protein n=1 Tax=Polycladomyces zharkentensis TaxID=2807616 RepID=A0ABS2WLW6_9BACL|nr:enoyl-CoA hydratase/isomerase family protein [Polycladomyces sp. WAk]